MYLSCTSAFIAFSYILLYFIDKRTIYCQSQSSLYLLPFAIYYKLPLPPVNFPDEAPRGFDGQISCKISVNLSHCFASNPSLNLFPLGSTVRQLKVMILKSQVFFLFLCFIPLLTLDNWCNFFQILSSFIFHLYSLHSNYNYNIYKEQKK